MARRLLTYTTPDPQAVALLTIDVQRDFGVPRAPAEIPGTAEALPAMRSLAEGFRSLSRPIFHAVRLYLSDGSNVDLCRRTRVKQGWRVVVPGSEGAAVVDELLPSGAVSFDGNRLLAGELQEVGINEWVLYKPRRGRFFKTEFEAHLRRLGVTTLVMCSCNFPNCPRATI